MRSSRPAAGSRKVRRSTASENHSLRCTRSASVRAKPPFSPRTGANRSPATTCSATSSDSMESPATATAAKPSRSKTQRYACFPSIGWRNWHGPSRRCNTICTSSCRARSGAIRMSCSCSAACVPRSGLAVFLLNLSDRYRRRGYSPTEFVLRMTREEIGSYLGLKLETVSRLLSRLQEEGLLQVQGRTVKLLDLPALQQLAGSALLTLSEPRIPRCRFPRATGSHRQLGARNGLRFTSSGSAPAIPSRECRACRAANRTRP